MKIHILTIGTRGNVQPYAENRVDQAVAHIFAKFTKKAIGLDCQRSVASVGKESL